MNNNGCGQSQVHEGAKRGDSVLCIELDKPIPVSGDFLVRFYNKPKMMKKVCKMMLMGCMDCSIVYVSVMISMNSTFKWAIAYRDLILQLLFQGMIACIILSI